MLAEPGNASACRTLPAHRRSRAAVNAMASGARWGHYWSGPTATARVNAPAAPPAVHGGDVEEHPDDPGGKGGDRPRAPPVPATIATIPAVVQPLRQAAAAPRCEAGRSAPARRSATAGTYQTPPDAVTAATPRARTAWGMAYLAASSAATSGWCRSNAGDSLRMRGSWAKLWRGGGQEIAHSRERPYPTGHQPRPACRTWRS